VSTKENKLKEGRTEMRETKNVLAIEILVHDCDMRKKVKISDKD
jgi:hypothetical protein